MNSSLFEIARVLVRFDHVARRIVNAHNRRVKYWEIIADNLSKAGWSWGCVSALDSHGRTIWIVDAHGYRKRFIVRADENAGCVFGARESDTRVCGEFGLVMAVQKRACG